MRLTPLLPLLAASLFLAPLACTVEEGDPSGEEETGDGDGDGDPDAETDTPGDGDGDATGDTDTDTDPTDTDTDPTGDGDGDDSAGDGDGDDATGDGDGDAMGCGVDPGWGQVAIGQPIKHIVGKDQHGETVSICDMAGKAVAIDVAAVWCGPCQAASAYLGSGQGSDPFSGLGPALKSNIDNGTFIWVTTLIEDANGGPGTVADGAAWDESFPNPNIPVLTEDDIPMLSNYLPGNCVPRVFVIDPDQNFFGTDDCMTWNQLGDLVDTFGE